MEIDGATVTKSRERRKKREGQLLQTVDHSLADAFTDLPDDAHSANRRRIISSTRE